MQGLPSASPVQDEPRQRLVAAGVALGGGFLILMAKAAAFGVSGSVALKSDALESVVNCLAAAAAMWSLRTAHTPADQDHPFGHGKVEHVTAAFEGGLVLLAGLIIGVDSAKRFGDQGVLNNLDTGLLINLGAGALNGLLGAWLLRRGRALRSPALVADGIHVLSDFWTTLAVGGGLGAALLTGWTWVDPLIGSLMAVLFVRSGFILFKKAFDSLVDREDMGLVAAIVGAFNVRREPPIIAVHGLRTLRAGRYTHIDVHVVVPGFYPVTKAHAAVDRLEQAILSDIRVEGEFHSHVDPCMKRYCCRCDVPNCPDRLHASTGATALRIEEATLPEAD